MNLDRDIKHYLLWGAGGLGAFILLAVLFFAMFHTSYRIVLSAEEVDFGSDVRIVDLVQSVGDRKIMPGDRISENTIQLEGYEMTFDEIDAQKLGPQELDVIFSIPDAEDQTITVTVVDREDPVITMVGEGPFSMDLQDVRDRKFEELYTVSDNCSAVGALEVESHVQEETFDFGQTVTVRVNAKDSSGNTAERSFEIRINPDPEEERKKQEEKKKQESDREEQEEATADTGSETTRDEPVQQPAAQPSAPAQTPSVQAPVQQSRPKPANKQFLFSQGYDMNTALAACSAELAASGYPGSCIPMQGSDGLYTGMQLIFD